MSFDADRLYELLPAIYRIRDAEQGEPLRDLLSVIAEQVGIVEENLDQLYDDQFIETCANWVTPYIGTLIGYRALHGVTPKISSPRAEVANTIAFRRRKGTAAMLEQLARDVTGWPARVVEFFQRLATTQYMNHIRSDHAFTPDLRAWEPLERLDTAFDSLAHTVEVRSIVNGAGRYNIPNIGVFLWRLKAHRLADSPAVGLPGDNRRFLLSPLGNNTPLFTRPESEDRITHLAEPLNVPDPISRCVLDDHLEDYYGAGKSILIKVDDEVKTIAEVHACNLSDIGGGDWAHGSDSMIGIDPVLGRIAFPEDVTGQVLVTYHSGFSADIGGGAYERQASLAQLGDGQAPRHVPNDFSTIQAALDDLPAAGGVVEITDNGRYEETPSILVSAENGSVEVRAANERRPTIVMTGDLTVAGADQSKVSLNGLLISGGGVRVLDTGDNALEQLSIRHCTLVPGLTLDIVDNPQQAGAPSVRVDIADVNIEIMQAIVGALRIDDRSEIEITDTIVDATANTAVAYAGPLDGPGEDPPGGDLTLRDSTVIGKIYSERLRLVSNSILFAALDPAGDTWPAPVRAVRKQDGCLRFSFVPFGSIVPRRFRCQPQLEIASEIARRENEVGGPLSPAEQDEIAAHIATRMIPGFTATRYGHPGYGQLLRLTPLQIRTGAENEAEMGAFRKLYQPQRETNLRIRFDEYLRFGLEAGIFYET